MLLGLCMLYHGRFALYRSVGAANTDCIVPLISENSFNYQLNYLNRSNCAILLKALHLYSRLLISRCQREIKINIDLSIHPLSHHPLKEEKKTRGITVSVNYLMMVGKIGKDGLISVFKMQRFFCLC